MKFISQHPFLQGPQTIQLYQANNGLRILLLPDPSARVLAYQTWFRVGSRNEQPGKTGIAHLFEHLMFNQTKHLAPGQFDRTIEAQGGSTNAATWVDWTYYQVDLPSSELDLAIRLEAERMQHLVLEKEPLESEREVVLNERRFRVEDDIQGFMHEQLFKHAYIQHPYHWPTIGWMEDIRAIGLDDARAFYNTFYAPNNATIVVVGDFEPDQALQKIEQHYGHIQSQPIPISSFPEEPAQREARRAVFRKPSTTERLVCGFKGPSLGHPDHVVCQLLSEILCGGPSSRLYRDLVVEQEIASSVSTYMTPFEYPGLFEVQVVTQRGRTVSQAEERIHHHLAAIRNQGPSHAEIERAKARMQTAALLGLRTAHGKAESLGEYQTTGGDYRMLFEELNTLRTLDAVAVQRVTNTYMQPHQATTIISLPADAG